MNSNQDSFVFCTPSYILKIPFSLSVLSKEVLIIAHQIQKKKKKKILMASSTSSSNYTLAFEREHYVYWSSEMETIFMAQDLWDVVEIGYNKGNKSENLKRDDNALRYI
ncbi:DUF4219 domain-containing protein [Cephalotus follicularis]|uniref:DUF4219 domain-containing protein n=1 Tax=Cephalotus follicularis TaxID=3775 RepID=A0A1Q3CH08_CEPFO|nr:DUF4219 domain-containing protein [Cephalotus follicularis]